MTKPDKEQLEAEYATMGMDALAVRYGCTVHCLRGWLIEYGIPIRASGQHAPEQARNSRKSYKRKNKQHPLAMYRKHGCGEGCPGYHWCHNVREIGEMVLCEELK